MLRLLESDTSGNVSDDDDDSLRGRHFDSVKQRVLIQFLVSCAESEVSSLFDNVNMDPELTEARKSLRKGVPAAKKKEKTSSAHEELTLKLLGSSLTCNILQDRDKCSAQSDWLATVFP